jgi:hypothetical protein
MIMVPILVPLLLPNGLELSGPAKTRSYFRAELAGSAPASG